MRTRISVGDGDPRHGTVNGYTNLCCRCGECKAAWADYHLAYMRAHPEQRTRHNVAMRRLRAARKLVQS